MKKCKPVGLTYTLNGITRTMQSCSIIFTKAGKVLKELQETVLSLENEKRIDGYIKTIKEIDKPDDFIPYPSAFEKAIKILCYLGVSTELIDEAPDKKTKGKYIIVTLTPEQEAELQKLKTLCV